MNKESVKSFVSGLDSVIQDLKPIKSVPFVPLSVMVNGKDKTVHSNRQSRRLQAKNIIKFLEVRRRNHKEAVERK